MVSPVTAVAPSPCPRPCLSCLPPGPLVLGEFTLIAIPLPSDLFLPAFLASQLLVEDVFSVLVHPFLWLVACHCPGTAFIHHNFQGTLGMCRSQKILEPWQIMSPSPILTSMDSVSSTHFSKWLLDSHKTRQKATGRTQQQFTEHTCTGLERTKPRC